MMRIPEVSYCYAGIRAAHGYEIGDPVTTEFALAYPWMVVEVAPEGQPSANVKGDESDAS